MRWHADPRMRGHLAMVLHALCGGAYWPVQKHLLRYAPPAQLNWLQMVLLLALMAPLCAPRWRSILTSRPPWVQLVAFGTLAAIIFYARAYGINVTTASTAVIVTRSEAVFSLVLSYLLLGQYITGWAWAGAALLAVGSFAPLSLSSSGVSSHPIGVLALLICALGTAFNGVIIKRYLTSTSNAFIVFTSGFCQAVLFTIILLPGGAWRAAAPLLAPELLGELLLSVLLVAGMLYLYYYALERIPLANARIMALMIPTVAVLGDHFWLGSALGYGQAAGLLAVTAGAALVIFRGGARSRGEADDVV